MAKRENTRTAIRKPAILYLKIKPRRSRKDRTKDRNLYQDAEKKSVIECMLFLKKSCGSQEKE